MNARDVAERHQDTMLLAACLLQETADLERRAAMATLAAMSAAELAAWLQGQGCEESRHGWAATERRAAAAVAVATVARIVRPTRETEL